MVLSDSAWSKVIETSRAKHHPMERVNLILGSMFMALWWAWFRCVQELCGACARRRTFLWMSLVLAGVSSFVRVLGLEAKVYRRLLHVFHTPGLNL